MCICTQSFALPQAERFFPCLQTRQAGSGTLVAQ